MYELYLLKILANILYYRYFKLSHSSVCLVASHCAFNLYFLMAKDVDHLFIGLLVIPCLPL